MTPESTVTPTMATSDEPRTLPPGVRKTLELTPNERRILGVAEDATIAVSPGDRINSQRRPNQATRYSKSARN